MYVHKNTIPQTNCHNKILALEVSCSQLVTLIHSTFPFDHESTLHSFFCFALFSFLTSTNSVCYFFFLFYFYILFEHILNNTKILQLNSIYSCVYTGMRFHLYISSPCSVFVFFPNCVYLISNCCFSTLQKVMNRVARIDDRHGPSPTLYDTAPLFVCADQLLCHCIFIRSNVHQRLVYLVCDDVMYCFLLAESYKTINNYHSFS